MAKLVDRRDIDFMLNEWLNVEQLTNFGYYADHSREIFDMVLDNVEKLSEEIIRPTNVDGDREGVKLENGVVVTPASFKKAYKEFHAGGWMSVCDDYEWGGQQLPRIFGVVGNMFLGAANHSFVMSPGLTHGAANLVKTFGTETQKKKFLPKMISGENGGTMCLTEPQAGSDVGNLTTVARRNPDGTFSIKGSKIFISWGDSDLYDNVIHPVLARIEGDPAGTKGISIFLVPKYRVDENGEKLGPNDVTVTGLEHKMGIHASPTCAIAFGENDDCIGELLGEERQGMKIMFQMMNGARLETGVQGLSCSEPAYRYALEYCRDRKQGSSIKEFKNPDAPRVSIIEHPNVRRKLMDMRAKVEAMRALIGYTALNLDLSIVAEGSERDTASDVVELLTPIVKAWCTDTGFSVNEIAIECLGGHGYLADHPLEQYMRDMKIASLYEGTNGIQAMDLLGRKLGMKGGAILMALLQRIGETAGRASDELKSAASLLMEAQGELAQTAMGLGASFAQGNIQHPLLAAKPFLDAMGIVVATWLLLWQAEVAEQQLKALQAEKGVSDLGAFVKENANAAYYYSKVRTAKYYAARYIPEARAKFSYIGSGDVTAMEAIFDDGDMLN